MMASAPASSRARASFRSSGCGVCEYSVPQWMATMSASQRRAAARTNSTADAGASQLPLALGT